MKYKDKEYEWFLTDINYDLLLLSYSNFEATEVLLNFEFKRFLDLLVLNYSKSNYVLANRDVLSSFISHKSKAYTERTHIFFKLVDIDESYYFNKGDFSVNKCKGYKLKDEVYYELIKNRFGTPRFIINRQEKSNLIYFDGIFYKNKKELMELNNFTRRGMEKVKLDKIEYLGLMTREMVGGSIKNISTTDIHKIVDKDSYDFYTVLDLDFDTKLRQVDIILEKIKNKEELTANEGELIPLIRPLHTLKNNPIVTYNRSSFGRLFCNELSGYYFNLQQYSKKLREFLFEGCFEYDISTAVASILPQVALKIDSGLYFPYIKAYIEDKNFFRNKIIDRGYTEKEAKQYFTSLFFGADVKDPHFKSKIIDTFSKDELLEIGKEEAISSLVAETNSLFNFLKSYYKVKNKVGKGWIFKNDFGGSLHFNNWATNENRVIPFIYQSIEALVMDYIYDNYNVLLFVFDGFYSKEDIDVEDLSEYILQSTGYSISFDKHKCYYEL